MRFRNYMSITGVVVGLLLLTLVWRDVFPEASLLQPERETGFTSNSPGTELASASTEQPRRVAESSGWRAEFLVIEAATGAPIEHARAAVLSPSGSGVESTADGQGRILCSVASGRPSERFIVRANGFRPEAVNRSEDDSSGQVMLVRAGEIRGRVVRAVDGASAGSEIRVLAWPAGEYCGEADFRLALACGGSDRVLVGFTEKDGQFTIDGVAVNRKYHVSAVGGGWCSRDVQRGSSRTSDAVTLEVFRAFYVAIRITASGKVPLRADPELIRGGRSLRPINVMLKPLHRTMLRMDLRATVPSELLEREADWGRNAVVEFRGADVPDGVRPRVVYSAGVPGYERATGEFVMVPLGDPVEWQYLECKPLGDGWGAVALRFKNIPQGHRPELPARHPIALVRFFERGASQREPFGGRLYPPLDRTHVLNGVPVGDYTVHVEMQEPDVSLEARPSISVRSGVRSSVSFDLEGYGSMAIFVEYVDGSPYTGSATFRIRSTRGGGFASFVRPPYYVNAVEAGRCTVAMIGGEGLNGIGAQKEEAFVQPGFESAVILRCESWR